MNGQAKNETPERRLNAGVTSPEVAVANASDGHVCLTRFELAALLNVSVRTVDRMIAAKEPPVRRVRGHVRFLRSDVEQYLKGGITAGNGGAQ